MRSLRNAGGESRTTPFDIVKDPRSPSTQEDLDAQYRQALRVWGRLSDVHEAVNTIREVKRQADHWADAGEEIATAAAALRESLTEVERDLVQVDPKGSGRLGNPDRVDGKLRVLLAHASFPARPTAASLEVTDGLSSRIDGALARLDAILEGQVAEFNELVRRVAAPAVAPRSGAAPEPPAAAAADTSDPREGS